MELMNEIEGDSEVVVIGVLGLRESLLGFLSIFSF